MTKVIKTKGNIKGQGQLKTGWFKANSKIELLSQDSFVLGQDRMISIELTVQTNRSQIS